MIACMDAQKSALFIILKFVIDEYLLQRYKIFLKKQIIYKERHEKIIATISGFGRHKVGVPTVGTLYSQAGNYLKDGLDILGRWFFMKKGF